MVIGLSSLKWCTRINSYIYVEWTEPDSNKAPRWYHYQVAEYHVDRNCNVTQADSATEWTNLHHIKWKFGQKSSKLYIPITKSTKYIL